MLAVLVEPLLVNPTPVVRADATITTLFSMKFPPELLFPKGLPAKTVGIGMKSTHFQFGTLSATKQ